MRRATTNTGPKYEIIGGRESPEHLWWWFVQARDGGIFEIPEKARLRLRDDYLFADEVRRTVYS